MFLSSAKPPNCFHVLCHARSTHAPFGNISSDAMLLPSVTAIVRQFVVLPSRTCMHRISAVSCKGESNADTGHAPCEWHTAGASGARQELEASRLAYAGWFHGQGRTCHRRRRHRAGSDGVELAPCRRQHGGRRYWPRVATECREATRAQIRGGLNDTCTRTVPGDHHAHICRRCRARQSGRGASPRPLRYVRDHCSWGAGVEPSPATALITSANRSGWSEPTRYFLPAVVHRRAPLPPRRK